MIKVLQLHNTILNFYNPSLKMPKHKCNHFSEAVSQKATRWTSTL